MDQGFAARYGREFAPGDVLFQDGDPCGHVFVIRSGSVRVSKRVGRRWLTIAELGAGDLVGELALITGRPHSAAAVATSRTRCLAIDVATLEAMVSQDGEIAVRLIKALAARLASANRLLEVLAHQDVRTRLVVALARRADVSRELAPEGIVVGKDLAELAQFAAVAEADVAAVTSHLSQVGLLRIQEEGIVITDLQRLHELARSTET